MGKKSKADDVQSSSKKEKKFHVNIKRMKSHDAKSNSQKSYKSIERIKEQKKAEKEEKNRKVMEYKKKRLEKTKVISKKTSRGQPLMKNRIEYLLKQIQEMKKP